MRFIASGLISLTTGCFFLMSKSLVGVSFTEIFDELYQLCETWIQIL
jgi:hypothetical protein